MSAILKQMTLGGAILLLAAGLSAAHRVGRLIRWGARPLSMVLEAGTQNGTLLHAGNGLSAEKQKTLVGVLEDAAGHYSGQPDIRAVRVVFQKNGDYWQAFPSQCPNQRCLKQMASKYPVEVAWTVTYHGIALGRLSARTPKAFEFYSDLGLQQIISPGPVPTVGRKSKKFAGPLDSAVYRPLVAVSQPFAGDPQDWSSTTLPRELVRRVRQAFRKRFPHVLNCKNPDENIAKPWMYGDENITLADMYSSREHRFIIQTALSPYMCDGPTPTEFVDQWFEITPHKEVRFLATGLQFMDAGDYDNTGVSELVFSIAGKDTGGFEMFYDSLSKHVAFTLSYH